MKTLDEVIDYAHMIVPMIGESDTKEMWRSIEYYLTAHKKNQLVIEKIALGRIKDVIDTIDNSPLTWDELKQMEGKHVWVEDEDNYSRWEIINGVYDFGISFGDYYLNKNEFGTVWQAYRKERK